VLITYASGSQNLILDHSPHLEGLLPDMPLQQALSLHGDSELIHADIPHYWHVFNRILDLLEEKSPVVEGAELGLAYIGLDGLQTIYQNDSALVSAIQETIPTTFAAQIGISENKFLAYLVAHYSHPCSYRKLEGNIDVFLKDIPCDILPITMKNKNKLHDFGIHTLGQIASLPPGPVQSQFGIAGKKMWQLSKGYDDTPLYPRCMEQAVEESTVLTSVTVSIEIILVTVESLLSRIFAGNALKGRGIRSFNLWTRGWDYWEQNVRFKEPTLNIKSIIPRTKQILENFPQPGPVEELGIRVTRSGYQVGQQKSLFPEVRASDNLLDAARELELRLGGPRIFQIKKVELWSRIPERRYVLTPSNQ